MLFHVDRCGGGWSYSPHNAYAASKLAIVLHTKALSRQLSKKKSNVLVNCVHPGVVNTALYQHLHWTVAWVFHFMKQFFLVSVAGNSKKEMRHAARYFTCQNKH